MTLADTPVPGFYKRRFVRGGVYVPIRIARFCCCTINGGDDSHRHIWRDTCDRYPRITALVDGRRIEDVDKHWTYCAGQTISATEYQFMVKDTDWCEVHDLHDPKMTPTKPIDKDLLRSIF